MIRETKNSYDSGSTSTWYTNISEIVTNYEFI